MISVVVFSPSLLRPAGADVAPEAIVRSLSALVRGAVEGLIGDVTIAGAAGDQLAEIADHAGCGFVEVADPAQGLFRGITASRGPALFLLQAGYAPNAGFIEEAGDLLASLGRLSGARLLAEPHNFPTRLFPGFSPLAGLIAARGAALDVAATDIAALAKGLGVKRALRTRARRVL